MKIDLLNLQPQTISRDLRSKYILLSGAPKVGKTEFCSMIPDSLILAFEIGTNARPGAYVQIIDSWSTFKQVLRQLEKDAVRAKFSTICIDTVGIAWDLCEKFICGTNGVQKIGEIPYGQGYTALSKEFETTLRQITMLGYGLIMTCHLKQAFNDSGELVAAQPDLNNRCLKIVNGLADVIGVIFEEWDEENHSHRWIQTRATPRIQAGSRFRYLKERIPFGYEDFVQALNDAIDEEENHGATIVTTQKIVTERSFEEIRAESLELWTALISAQPQFEEEILFEIEQIMGVSMRLSDFTPAQASMMELINSIMREKMMSCN